MLYSPSPCVTAKHNYRRSGPCQRQENRWDFSTRRVLNPRIFWRMAEVFMVSAESTINIHAELYLPHSPTSLLIPAIVLFLLIAYFYPLFIALFLFKARHQTLDNPYVPFLIIHSSFSLPFLCRCVKLCSSICPSLRLYSPPSRHP